MSPVPVARDGVRGLAPMALTRGLGRLFAGCRQVPNLDLHGPVATAEAERLFWEILTASLDQGAAARGGRVRWVRRHAGQTTIILVTGVQEREARDLWANAVYAASQGEGNPGLAVSAPRFRACTGLDRATRQRLTAVFIECWPVGRKGGGDDGGLPPLRFRHARAPGYLALLARYEAAPYVAEGWLWRSYNGRREGFRLAGLPEEAEAIGTGARRVARWSTYDGQDLLLCLFEAFFRQRDAWVTERVRLPDGCEVLTTPWRLLCLDPHALRARLDPGQTWGANWRGRLFARVAALAAFERQLRTPAGRVVDAGDRLVRRVVDGRRAVDPGSPAEGGVGLLSVLRRAGALPVDAFFVEVSLECMARLVTWAVDDRGAVHWGAAAARAAERAALAARPEDRRGARQLRDQVRRAAQARPYYLHSPRLLSVGNLERWPVRRKLLAYALLQEVRARRASRGGGRTAGRRPNDRAYVACNGSRGHGYRVTTWLDKAGADRGRGLGGFLADLAALRRTLGLRLELRSVGKAGGKTVWDAEALAVLTAYRRTPVLAGALRLRIYLPADLETQLRARLAAVGIEAVDDGDDAASLLQARAPRQPAPAALRLARRRAGWTQADLARRLGVTPMAVSLWERGQEPMPRPRVAALRRIFAAYWSASPRASAVRAGGDGAGARPSAMSRAG